MKDIQNAIEDLNNFLDSLHEESKQKEPKYTKDFNYYANIVNPETGKPYIIPMLDYTDPEYVNKYVEYMKLKEEQPETFKKIMNWD